MERAPHIHTTPWIVPPAALLGLLVGSLAGCRAAPPPAAELGVEALRRNRSAELSEDPGAAAALETSLRDFLAEADRGEFTGATVPPGDLDRYAFFFRGLRSFSSRKAETFDPPTLLKSYSFDGSTYFVTVAFSGVRDGAPFLHKIVELKAVPHGDRYRFTSPFEERTARLPQVEIGNVTFHHGGPFDGAAARRFAQFRQDFSQQTGTPNPPLNYYSFGSLDELLTSFGFVFDCTKCNFLAHDLGFSSLDGQSFYTGTANPSYIYEYVGDHIRQHLPNPDEMYGPFLNGLSVCYGGYALSGDDLPTLKGQFRAALAEDPQLDFLEEFKKGRKASVNRHFSFYVMSAFLCEMALERGNFEAARRLLYSGSGGDRFFSNLEAVLGVNESNFHSTISARIGAE